MDDDIVRMEVAKIFPIASFKTNEIFLHYIFRIHQISSLGRTEKITRSIKQNRGFHRFVLYISSFVGQPSSSKT